VRLTVRYAVLIGGVIGWIAVMNSLLSSRPWFAGLLLLTTVAIYWQRRWRIPSTIARTNAGVNIVGNGTPTVVEFYADL
jgi:hypothetical protein